MQEPSDITAMTLADESVLAWARVVEQADHDVAVRAFGARASGASRILEAGHWRAPVQSVLVSARRIAIGAPDKRTRTYLLDDLESVEIVDGAVQIESTTKSPLVLRPAVGFAAQLAQWAETVRGTHAGQRPSAPALERHRRFLHSLHGSGVLSDEGLRARLDGLGDMGATG